MNASSVKDLPAIRVAIVEDEPLYRSLLRTLLSGARGIDVVAEAASVDAAGDIDPHGVDVALIDVGLGDLRSGVDVGLAWRRESASMAVVLLTSHANERLLSAVPQEDVWRWSYLLKSSVSDVHALVHAIRSAAAGHRIVDPHLARGQAMRPGSLLEQLTHQQLAVIRAVASGASNAQIARDQHMTVKGIESLLRRTLPLLGIDTANRSINPRVAATVAVLTGLVPQTDLVTERPIGGAGDATP